MRATAATAAATSAKQECSQPTPEWVYKPSKMARLPCPFMPLLSYAHHIEREPSTCTLSHNPSRCRLPAFRIVDGRYLLASSARMRLRPESARLVAFRCDGARDGLSLALCFLAFLNINPYSVSSQFASSPLLLHSKPHQSH